MVIKAGFPGGSVVKNPNANAGDTGDVGSIPGSGRSPGGGNVNMLQNPVDRGAWQATVHGVAKRGFHLSITYCVSWVPRLTLLAIQTNWTYKCALRTELVHT